MSTESASYQYNIKRLPKRLEDLYLIKVYFSIRKINLCHIKNRNNSCQPYIKETFVMIRMYLCDIR